MIGRQNPSVQAQAEALVAEFNAFNTIEVSFIPVQKRKLKMGLVNARTYGTWKVRETHLW
jgi:hypothetical protein